MEAEPGLGAHAPPPQAAHGLDVAVLGVQEHLVAAEGPPGSFLLHARAPCAVGRVAGLRVLLRGRRLDAEVVEALRGLCRPLLEVVEVAKGTVQESPQRR